jgi:hypothetical protein
MSRFGARASIRCNVASARGLAHSKTLRINAGRSKQTVK